MSEQIIDEKTRTYLTACLVTGVDVQYGQEEFMKGLVSHMNMIERPYWTEGDGDGVIIHDECDQPFLMLMYNGQRLTFRTFDQDEFTAMNTSKNIGFSLLNILDYIRTMNLEFCPSILGSEANRVKENS